MLGMAAYGSCCLPRNANFSFYHPHELVSSYTRHATGKPQLQHIAKRQSV